MKKKIALLGSTGSIGLSTLEVVRNNRDRFQVTGLACGNNMEMLRSQIKEFDPDVISLESGNSAEELKREFPGKKIYYGPEGLMEVAMAPGTDTLVTATSGTHAIAPTLEALKKGFRICLANKETLVAAGSLINRHMRDSASEIIPIDSEQSAVFQCIGDNDREFLKKVILTASGGPFFRLPDKDFKSISVKDALNHPVWSMGKKITIDSATLMNKALEIIEAFHLFHLKKEQIDILIHPQSIVHSMVEFIDHSVISQMGVPDMKIPIQYSLSYPDRYPGHTAVLDLSETGVLEFFEADREKFPSIEMAFEVIDQGKNAGLIFNASNESAVDSFLKGEIEFVDIFKVVREMLDRCGRNEIGSADEIFPMISEVKKKTSEYINEIKK